MRHRGERYRGHQLLLTIINLSAAFSSASLFLQNANLVTERPHSGEPLVDWLGLERLHTT